MLSLRPDDEVVEVHRRDFAVQFVCDLPAQCHKRVIAAPSFTQVVCRSPCGSRSRNSRQHGHQFQATLEQPLLQRLGEAADGAGRILVEVFEVGAEVEDEELALVLRSEEHTSELQSLMRISYAVFCLKK